VETTREHALTRIERFLDRITMMAIHIHIEDARERAEELENPQHNVVNIAESTGAILLRVMQSTSPVDRDVCGPCGKGCGGRNRASSGNGAEFESTFVCGVIHTSENCAIFELS
jgi:hypothetical protein